MTKFQHKLWGYELSYPDNWTHKTIEDSDGFAANPEALTPNYAGPDLGHLLVRGEWNGSRQPIETLWGQHVGKLAVMLGAKNIGAAPWQMGGASGFEVEIVLPKRSTKRLWAGILARGTTLLHFMVLHHKEERDRFEPLATQIISSLRFIEHADDIATNQAGLPLPPNYTPIDPNKALPDITDPEYWQAYDGNSGIGALQTFYLREARVHGWEITEYVPFPSESELDFARLKLQKEGRTATLGILPSDEEIPTAKIAIKYG
ncbi:MAG: hypothetical protein U9Q82_11430 [Chloroflexota bacterium]|nr:hypothetical protein [Chloroflexota bacterium]